MEIVLTAVSLVSFLALVLGWVVLPHGAVRTEMVVTTSSEVATQTAPTAA